MRVCSPPRASVQQAWAPEGLARRPEVRAGLPARAPLAWGRQRAWVPDLAAPPVLAVGCIWESPEQQPVEVEPAVASPAG